jgi:hypothetical protein
MSALPSSSPVQPPSRHGADLATGRRMARGVRLLIRGASPEATPQQWAALGSALWRGDPQADAVVAWLHQVGMGVGRPLLERAIERGLDALPDAPAPLADFIRHVEATPAWVDPAKLRDGARFIHRTGRFGMLVLRDAGLMAGYQAGAINQALVMTGALARGAQRRVAETTSWWIDATAQDGMSRFGAGFKNTLRVRVLHAIVRRSLLARDTWDRDTLGTPLNQVDMQATYLGFSVVHLMALRVSGVVVSRRDAEGMMHLWRYIGWVMGVDDALLSDDEHEARVLIYQNIVSQSPPDDSSKALGRSLMDEPLGRHYRWLPGVQGRFNRARHLSVARLFVGSEGMKALGLPPTLPWYPALTLLPRLAWHTLGRVVPGVQAAQERYGRGRQVGYLPVLFGGHAPGVASAEAVSRSAHP